MAQAEKWKPRVLSSMDIHAALALSLGEPVSRVRTVRRRTDRIINSGSSSLEGAGAVPEQRATGQEERQQVEIAETENGTAQQIGEAVVARAKLPPSA